MCKGGLLTLLSALRPVLSALCSLPHTSNLKSRISSGRSSNLQQRASVSLSARLPQELEAEAQQNAEEHIQYLGWDPNGSLSKDKTQRRVEAAPGVEPGKTELQSVPLPLG